MADDTSLPITRALLSVSDKTGLVELGTALADMGVEILSTGGTARALREAGLTVIDVADHTGFPEMLDGRVKTLHPTIHGGILGRRDRESHRAAMAEHDIGPIDLVAINLYPFEQTVAGGAGFDDCIENIDIGGPALIRSAAKNHAFVAVLTDPAAYGGVIAEMRSRKGGLTNATRRSLAAAAYARTAAYDSAIATWFAPQSKEEDGPPKTLLLSARRIETLRYGENPHQRAAFYATSTQPAGLAAATQVQGKALSYNNLNDADAALALIQEFTSPTVAIIKHANPCGVATGATLADAYGRARACDPTSAFGGIIAVNRSLDAAAAEAITSLFAEVVIAPDAGAEARAVFAAKKNLRLLLTGDSPDAAEGWALRTVAGGILVQDRDTRSVGRDDLKVVTERAPTEAEIDDLLFAFTVCKHVKSNAIIYVKDGATVGIGAGQMSRVDSARIAVIKAREAAEAAGETTSRIEGSVVASDAFFPFADGLVAAAEAGATAVVQPGGSVRDDEVIDEANRRGLAMVMTGVRHFRH